MSRRGPWWLSPGAPLDTLRSAHRRRETYVGQWLPEPLLAEAGMAPDPADRVTLDESVSFALLVVLETLSPAERTAWVLHDLFRLEFTEVAEVVGRTPAAVRQLASRARRHVAAGTPRVGVDRGQHEAAVAAFTSAAAGGDLAALTVDGGRITRVDFVLSPSKLAAVSLSPRSPGRRPSR